LEVGEGGAEQVEFLLGFGECRGAFCGGGIGVGFRGGVGFGVRSGSGRSSGCFGFGCGPEFEDSGGAAVEFEGLQELLFLLVEFFGCVEGWAGGCGRVFGVLLFVHQEFGGIDAGLDGRAYACGGKADGTLLCEGCGDGGEQ
jgi:hypothetical protein